MRLNRRNVSLHFGWDAPEEEVSDKASIYLYASFFLFNPFGQEQLHLSSISSREKKNTGQLSSRIGMWWPEVSRVLVTIEGLQRGLNLFIWKIILLLGTDLTCNRLYVIGCRLSTKIWGGWKCNTQDLLGLFFFFPPLVNKPHSEMFYSDAK